MKSSLSQPGIARVESTHEIGSSQRRWLETPERRGDGLAKPRVIVGEPEKGGDNGGNELVG